MKRYSLMFIALLAVSACASASKPGAMVLEVRAETIIADNSALREAITVGAVEGGKETNPLWTSEVSNEDFAEALRQSLAAHAMLAIDDGAYRLDAEMEELKQPLAGFNVSVTARVRYMLTALASDETVFAETIETKYTAKMGDALVGVKRLQLANEGAVKANISALIEALIARVDDADADLGAAGDEGAAPRPRGDALIQQLMRR